MTEAEQREPEAVGDGLDGPWELATRAAGALSERLGDLVGAVAVVLGSGWAPAADVLGAPVTQASLAELPGFPTPAVAGHRSEVRRVDVAGRPVVVLLGRVHGYEGWSPGEVVHALRAALLAGASQVVLTNAAGGVRADLPVGGLVAIADQLNLTGRSPLSGSPPPPSLPGRFVDMVDAYSPRLRQAARNAGAVAEGVYAGLPGPQYETPAEVRLLARLGADLVGMSTVWEAIAARHLGAEVAGISLVTNHAAGVVPGGVAHEEVLAVGKERAEALGGTLGALLEEMGRLGPLGR